MPRKNNRAPQPELIVPAVDFFSDVSAVWLVTVRNGSGQRQVEISGTQASAWSYAEECARRGVYGHGMRPVDIMHLHSADYAELFATV